MAYVLNYTDPNTGANYPNAYAKITDLKVVKSQEWALAQVATYASQASRTAGKSPVAQQQVIFAGLVAGAPDTYTGVFAAPPVAAVAPLAAPVNVDDIALAQAYVGLKTHPATAALFATATVV